MKTHNKKQRILILNWRDIKNPAAGGAEFLTHELARRLVKDGNSVLYFSSIFPGAKKKEEVDGVEIIRDGYSDARKLFSSVHYKAFKYYKKNLKGNIDLVIDEVHGIPFFTTFYIKERKALLICEVAGGIWDMVFSFPFNAIGRFIERIYGAFYKNIPIITISESTKKELIAIGFKKKNISVIPLGCNTPIVEVLLRKNSFPTVIFIGRLTKAKGIEEAIKVVSIIKTRLPNIKLEIIGRGEEGYTRYLKGMIDKLSLSKNISLHGFLMEKRKIDILDKSHILILPSAKEGWGLTVHEAGARGTPAIGYRVEGLKEVIVDGVNGFLCDKNTPENMANLCIKLLNNKSLYFQLQTGAISERKKYTWENTYKKFKKAIGL